MKANVEIPVGSAIFQFQVEGEDLKKVLHAASFYTRFPKECGKCKGTNLYIRSNKDTDGNLYVNLVCQDCQASCKLHGPQKKDPTVFWWETEEGTANLNWVIWSGSKSSNQEEDKVQPSPEEAGQETIDDSELPF